MRLLQRSKQKLEIKKKKKGKTALYIVGVIVIIFGAASYRGYAIFKELEMSARAYTREVILSVTKNWNYRELLLRASREFNEKADVRELTRTFNFYGEKLGSLKALIDYHGKVTFDLKGKAIVIKANYKADAIYEKGRALIDVALVYSSDKWMVDSFSLSSQALSVSKDGPSKSIDEKKQPVELSKEKGVEQVKLNVVKSKEEADGDLEEFTYTSKGKRDPFFAVILNQRKRALKEKSEKGGYELEELKVVGILKTDKEKLVMMEDKQGNGILFRRGDYINKNLWIVDISDEKIVCGYRLKNEVRTIVMDVQGKK
ncbi:MAG: pilus assembly protein PilP [Deltaproteobacteria bacterium]|nr:pilus assembly protein PilP [Deltaproteobacteria bacterium]